MGFCLARVSSVSSKKIVEGLSYLCSENKGADQLYGYCAADLHLDLCIYAKAWFLMTRLKLYNMTFFLIIHI